MLLVIELAAVHTLHIPYHHRRIKRQSTQPTLSPSSLTERLTMRKVIDINADNYDSKIDEIADTLRDVLTNNYARKNSQQHTLRHRQALGAFSVTLETYVLSAHAARDLDIIENEQVDRHHSRLHHSMLQAGK